ncbi:unnamed protein product [Kuraishia capsulata CBS 1993]|uniref:BTB domain-containing protein n=1 Tax=Kuraishia capsulata CBS 1993 TaxID=1382522 RepID=W6MI76_9ASCO|nr:uncharacterized protein KUCA_T00001553001 [Kuraishia capsulata CBS 1993]CDK25583.1 unnamed protein product [Kuraishia capsulata CBS 1993]
MSLRLINTTFQNCAFSSISSEPYGSIKNLSTLSSDDLEKRDVFGKTILHHICIKNRHDLLNRLIKNKNLDFNVTDWENDWNCLHFALFNNNFVLARILLAKGPESLLRHRDKDGYTPVDLLNSEISLKRMVRFPTHISMPYDGKIAAVLDFSEGSMNNLALTERITPASQEGVTSTTEESSWFDPFSRGASDLVFSGFHLKSSIQDAPDQLYHVPLQDMTTRVTGSIRERLRPPRLSKVVISKKHTMAVTNEPTGNLFVCGSGSSSRLGLGNSHKSLDFVSIPTFESACIVDAHSCDDHSVCLTSQNQVYTWGYNEYLDEVGSIPTLIPKLKGTIIGVFTSKIHTVAYTHDQIISWGLNVGQMGLASAASSSIAYNGLHGTIVKSPKEMEFKYGTVKCIVGNETFMLVLNTDDDLHCFTGGFHAKVPITVSNKLNSTFNVFVPRSQTRRKSIVKMIAQTGCPQVLLIYDSGDVSVVSIPQRCAYSSEFLKRVKVSPVWRVSKDHMKCIDACMGSDGSVMICLADGSAYRRVKRQQKKATSKDGFHDVFTKEFKFVKILGLNKVVRVCCDPSFQCFAYMRNDVDLIPFKLKQSQILNDIGDYSPYVSLPAQQKAKYSLASTAVDFIASSNEESSQPFELEDKLLENVLNRWSQPTNDIVKSWREKVKAPVSKRFGNDAIRKLGWMQLIKTESKLSDAHAVVIGRGGAKDVWIPIHKHIICSRSKVLASVILEGRIINKSGIGITYDPSSECLNFEGDKVDARAVFLLMHYLYTDEYLTYPASISEDLSRSRKMFSILTSVVLTLMPPLEKQIWKDVPQLYDTVVHLSDGEIRCHSLFLAARSAYFEALFSRWRGSSEREVTLTHIPKKVFEIVLRYCVGYHAFDIFDEIMGISSSSEFMDLLFETAEVADELLISDLSDICQFAMKDLISLDNVGLILMNAYHLGATPLFMNCLWFLYNNLDVMFFNGEFNELISECWSNQHLVTQIDVGLRWFKSLNRIADDSKKTTSLSTKESQNFFNCFLTDMDKFNEDFVAGENTCSFSGLASMFKTLEKKRRSSSVVKPVNSTSFPKYSPPVTSSEISPSSSSLVNEFALDTDDSLSSISDFIPVSSRRRSSRKSSGPNLIRPEIFPPAMPETMVSTPQRKSPTPLDIPKASSPFLSSRTPAKKAVIAIPKLSQKERMKQRQNSGSFLAQSPPKTSTPPKPTTPLYKIQPTGSAPAASSAPSFETIRLQEQLGNIEDDTPVASLEEIQREEEFARWWEQESLRVQERMNQAAEEGTQARRNSAQNRRRHKGRANNTKTGEGNNSNRHRGGSVII